MGLVAGQDHPREALSMFRFFTTAKWAVWAWLGSVVILSSLWVQVQIDVRINEWFHEVYDKARNIEGAAQRVQEDTIKFSRIVEGLGTSLIESILVLIEFLPI